MKQNCGAVLLHYNRGVGTTAASKSSFKLACSMQWVVSFDVASAS